MQNPRAPTEIYSELLKQFTRLQDAVWRTRQTSKSIGHNTHSHTQCKVSFSLQPQTKRVDVAQLKAHAGHTKSCARAHTQKKHDNNKKLKFMRQRRPHLHAKKNPTKQKKKRTPAPGESAVPSACAHYTEGGGRCIFNQRVGWRRSSWERHLSPSRTDSSEDGSAQSDPTAPGL